MPIKSPDGVVLGTFGTYFRNRRSPTPEEQKSVKLLATAAALPFTQSRHAVVASVAGAPPLGDSVFLHIRP